MASAEDGDELAVRMLPNGAFEYYVEVDGQGYYVTLTPSTENVSVEEVSSLTGIPVEQLLRDMQEAEAAPGSTTPQQEPNENEEGSEENGEEPNENEEGSEENGEEEKMDDDGKDEEGETTMEGQMDE